MLKSFLLVAWRNITRNKTFSFLNISGLTVGMAAAVLILLWIQHEVRFDKGYPNKDRIYEAWNRFSFEGKSSSWNFTPSVMAAAIQQDYPEVERTTRVHNFYPILCSYGDKKLSIRGNIVDSTFLDIFGFPLLKGDAHTVLNDPFSIVLTEKLATSLFGTENPIGKTLRLDNQLDFTVTGVLKDLPNDTRFKFQYLVNWNVLRLTGGDSDIWGMNYVATYVMLKPNATLASIQPKIKTLRKKYDKDDPAMQTFLYPITRTHLYGNFEGETESGGKIRVVQLFGLIASLILLIACINFMNLSTARSEKRAKEVGIRKVVGARKQSLIGQFLGESIMQAVIAGLFAILIVQLSLPAFNKLVGKQLSVDFGQPLFWIAALGFTFLTGILAGSYPAIFLSSFKPVKVLKGTFRTPNITFSPRKVLVVIQFTIAIVLIIATLIIRLQIKKGQDRQVNYNRENLVYHFTEGDAMKKYPLIKEELLREGAVLSMSKTSSPITESWSNSWAIEWEGKNPNDKTVIYRFSTEQGIVKTAGLQLVQGRDLDLDQYPTDSLGILINESAAKVMGYKDPIGKTIRDMGEQWHIVGVIKDFITSSPYKPIPPLVMAGGKAYFEVIHFRLNPANSTAHNIAVMEKVFKKYNPAYPFNYRFVDEEYGKKFDDERRSGMLATLFALLTILISCLGLFGLASYMAEKRTKEIGIRKVLGASVGSLTNLLSAEFLKLVLVSFLIASPIGYWAMHLWLQEFPYRVDLHWWVFALAGTLALTIALLTVSVQALRAALMNPVKSLRSE